MKQLLGFISGLFAVLLLLALAPRPMSERLATLRGDGLRLAQVYERIVQNPRPIDVAFIGSSHTVYGIDDHSLEENLSKSGVPADVANLGMAWMGRDMHLFLTKALLASKTPKVIVLEITEHESPYGHPLMPYVASASDMFCCRIWAEVNFPKLFLLFLKEQLYGAISRACCALAAPLSGPQAWDYGWKPVDRIWDRSEVAPDLSLGDRFENLLGSRAREAAYELTSNFGDHAVQQIVELARSQHVQVIFLYLADFRNAADPDLDVIDYYTSMAPVVLPSRSVVANPINWFDEGHTNQAGAIELVPGLTAAIAPYLTKE